MFATFCARPSRSLDDLSENEAEACAAVLGRHEPIPLDVAVGLMGEGFVVEAYETHLENLRDGEA